MDLVIVEDEVEACEEDAVRPEEPEAHEVELVEADLEQRVVKES